MGFDADSYRWIFWEFVEHFFDYLHSFSLRYNLPFFHWCNEIGYYIKERWHTIDMRFYHFRCKINKINQGQCLCIGYCGSWKISPMWDKEFPKDVIKNGDWGTLDRIKPYVQDYVLTWIKEFQIRSKKNKYLDIGW